MNSAMPVWNALLMLHPFITTFIQADPSFPTSLSRPTAAMADTGCQSCLAATSLLLELGLDQHHLILINMKMTIANSSPIDIISALTLHISGTVPSSVKCTTCQTIYIIPLTDKLSLFKQVSVALGMILQHFFMIRESCRNVGTPMETSPVIMTQNVHGCPLWPLFPFHYHSQPLRRTMVTWRSGC